MTTKLLKVNGWQLFAHPLFLAEISCRNLDDEQRLIYSDAGHMSKYGSLFVINAIKEELLMLLNSET